MRQLNTQEIDFVAGGTAEGGDGSQVPPPPIGITNPIRTFVQHLIDSFPYDVTIYLPIRITRKS